MQERPSYDPERPLPAMTHWKPRSRVLDTAYVSSSIFAVDHDRTTLFLPASQVDKQWCIHCSTSNICLNTNRKPAGSGEDAKFASVSAMRNILRECLGATTLFDGDDALRAFHSTTSFYTFTSSATLAPLGPRYPPFLPLAIATSYSAAPHSFYIRHLFDSSLSSLLRSAPT